jgi:ATP-binding protein involved in chromosome partitioning
MVVDLPPGTGDELLAAFRLFADNCRLLLVATPSKRALSVVAKLSKLAKQEKVEVVGFVLNMSYLVVGKKKLYVLGKAEPKSVEKVLGAKLLAEIPLEPKVNEEGLLLLLKNNKELAEAFRSLSKGVGARAHS